MEWAALATALVGLAGLVIKWWLDRRTKEEKLSDEISTEKREIDDALARKDYEALAVLASRRRDRLRVLMRKKS